jgi:hypothetical protein
MTSTLPVIALSTLPLGQDLATFSAKENTEIVHTHSTAKTEQHDAVRCTPHTTCVRLAAKLEYTSSPLGSLLNEKDSVRHITIQ